MNSGKIGGALAGLILGLIYINYGLLNMFIVALFVLIGYNYTLVFNRFKKLIRSGDQLLKMLRKKLREED